MKLDNATTVLKFLFRFENRRRRIIFNVFMAESQFKILYRSTRNIYKEINMINASVSWLHIHPLLSMHLFFTLRITLYDKPMILRTVLGETVVVVVYYYSFNYKSVLSSSLFWDSVYLDHSPKHLFVWASTKYLTNS